MVRIGNRRVGIARVGIASIVKRIGITSAVAMICLLSVVVPANAQNMGVVTGGPNGTYIQFGRNIAELAAKFGVALSVYESSGSLQNLEDVRWRKGVQLGIVQSDALQVAKNKAKVNRKSKRIVEGLRMVLPLYEEEVHVIARHDSDVTQFSDLDGKRIVVGPIGSGHYLTSLMMFVLSGIEPSEFIEKGGVDGVEAVKSGEADAMIYVAGMPTNLLKDNITVDDDIELVPILDKSIIDQYPRETVIPVDMYAWQAKEVPTIAIVAVLMTFNYRGVNCANVGKVSRMVSDNLDWLRENGHPKWANVDFEASVKDWEQYDCVVDALLNPRGYKLTSTGEPQPAKAQASAPAQTEGGEVYDLRKRVEDLLK